MLHRLVQTNGTPVVRLEHDGGHIVAEYSNAAQLTRRFVFGPGADEPLLWYEGAGTADRRWLHADERGSIVAISNAGGPVAEQLGVRLPAPRL